MQLKHINIQNENEEIIKSKKKLSKQLIHIKGIITNTYQDKKWQIDEKKSYIKLGNINLREYYCRCTQKTKL